MQLPYSDVLEIKYLSRLFDNTTECYKLFWFDVIVEKVSEGRKEISYEEIINEMIADAWYMVSEYHLNLGPNDKLERLIHYIKNISDLKPSEEKSVILEYLEKCTDKEVGRRRRELTINVPYRIQSPFLESIQEREWNGSKKKLIDKINQNQRALYWYSALDGMKTTVNIRPRWCDYINENQEILRGWIQYKMIQYLQRRNPNVPGIIDKLEAPTQRKLKDVQMYWKLLMEIQPIKEIYADEMLSVEDISIDHFVPWSYVANDEFWNLHPTTKGINSSKSNNLPNWEIYFPKFCKLEYLSYELMWKYDRVHDEFNKCAERHLNSYDIQNRVYRQNQSLEEFTKSLEEVLRPVYQSAENCGFKNWIYYN